MEQEEAPSQAEIVAALLSGTARMEHRGQVVPVMARFPVYTLAKIDAFAKLSGKSRNGVVNLLCEVGLQEVQKHLSAEIGESLLPLEAAAFSELVEDQQKSGEVY